MKPSMATRSSRCSRSYQRLKSSSCSGSTSIDVSSMPFPAIGIFVSPNLLVIARSVSDEAIQLYVRLLDCFAPLAMTASLASYPRCDARNRAHHRIAHAGIVERVTGAFNDAKLGIRPLCRQRMRGCGRAQEIIATLYDDTGNTLQPVGLVQNLVRPHEAVIGKVMRFHERSRGQGTCRFERRQIEPRARGRMLRQDPFGIVPGAREGRVHGRIGIENAMP